MMNTDGEESRMRDNLLSRGYTCFNRLYSFFYLEELEHALMEHKER